MLGLLCAAGLAESGVLAPWLLDALVWAMVATALMNIRLAETVPARQHYRESDSMMLHRVLGEKGGLARTGQRWTVQVPGCVRALQGLAEEVLLLQESGSEAAARTFLEQNALLARVEPLLQATAGIAV